MKKIEKIISKAIIGTDFENKTFIVGGYVRDKVMGIQSQDMDIVVELDNGGKKLADFLFRKRLSSRPVIFENFGTAFVMIENHKIEFVMTRKESYRDKNRKPDVAVGTLKEDIFRRDFTINSLIMNIISGEIKDITGKGISDIKKKIIRSTSNPGIIFGEDPLRMLRAIRFSIKLGFEIEPETAKGILENAKQLRHISWERRRDEIVKMLESDKPAQAINLLDEYNLLKNLIPELDKLKGLEQGKCHDLDAFKHTLKVLELTKPNLELRLAALLHDIGKVETISENGNGIHSDEHEKISAEISRKILKRLRFPINQIKRISYLIQNHMLLKNAGKNGEKISAKELRKLIFEAGENLDLLLELIHADNQVHTKDYLRQEQIPRIRKKIEFLKKDFSKKEMPVSGKDVMAFFRLKEGTKIGELLEKAKDIWFEHPEWGKEKILEKMK